MMVDWLTPISELTQLILVVFQSCYVIFSCIALLLILNMIITASITYQLNSYCIYWPNGYVSIANEMDRIQPNIGKETT